MLRLSSALYPDFVWKWSTSPEVTTDFFSSCPLLSWRWTHAQFGLASFVLSLYFKVEWRSDGKVVS